MAEALNEALREEMAARRGVFVIGEDIGMHGGLFGVTAGLLDRFGEPRVIDSPISEAGIAGAGVGAALVGCRPVVELQIFDFVTLTMDQVVNHAAKWRYMSGGQVSVPLVVRGPISSGIGMAAQHSQTLEAWFVHTPGLIVMMPSNAARRQGPAEERDPRGQPGRLPREAAALRAPGPGAGGRAPRADRRRGRQAAGHGRHRRRRPACACTRRCRPPARLARDGIEAEVIDPRTLKPLDIDTIGGSRRARPGAWSSSARARGPAASRARSWRG